MNLKNTTDNKPNSNETPKREHFPADNGRNDDIEGDLDKKSIIKPKTGNIWGSSEHAKEILTEAELKKIKKVELKDLFFVILNFILSLLGLFLIFYILKTLYF